MRSSEKFREYIWLVNTISRHQPITLDEINELWVSTEMSGGIELSRSTFLRHKDAIEEMFGLYIECNRHNGYRYYIGNEYVLHENSVQNWLLSTLTASSLISESLSMQHRILLESVPVNSNWLAQVVQAMRGSRKIRLSYCRYQSSENKSYLLEPYCLKLFRQRWYLLGRNGKGSFSVYAFDRIQKMEVLDEKFVIDEYFDAEDFFSECYGVVIGDHSQPVRIVLRAFGWERYSMLDVPVHHTQQVIREAEDHTDFEVTLRPTSDFKAHLLSRGRWLKVLHPASLAEEIRQLHLEAAHL